MAPVVDKFVILKNLKEVYKKPSFTVGILQLERRNGKPR